MSMLCVGCRPVVCRALHRHAAPHRRPGLCRKQRRDERLSQQASFQDSLDSDNSATPMNRDCRLSPVQRSRSETTTSDAPYTPSDAPYCCANGSSPRTRDPPVRAASASAATPADQLRLPTAFGKVRPPLTRSECVRHDSGQPCRSASRSDEEAASDEGMEPSGVHISSSRLGPLGRRDSDAAADEQITISVPARRRGGTLPARRRHHAAPPPRTRIQPSRSEQNLTTASERERLAARGRLPNGIVVLSPNGDVCTLAARPPGPAYVQPKNVANLKNFTTNIAAGVKLLPLKDSLVKATTRPPAGRALLTEAVIADDIETTELDSWTKEDLYEMWRTSEERLCGRLRAAISEKRQLELKLARLQAPPDDT